MIRTVVNFESLIFKATERRQAFSGFVRRQVKDFKDLTKRRMLQSEKTGKIYRRRSGNGFTRAHRASRRGQRPSPDTMTLVNAISDRRTGELSGEVFIAPLKNPANRQTADSYGEILQNELDRPIMSEADVEEAGRKMAREGEPLIRSLV